MTSPAQKMVARFGSQKKLADALSTRQSTVSHWVKTGEIPKRWHSKIMEAGVQAGISVEPRELMSTPVAMPVRKTVKPYAVVGATLTVSDADEVAPINCYVLNDGRRVISRTSAVGALAKGDDDKKTGGDLQRYVRPAESFLRVSLADELVEFELDNVKNKTVSGVTAECFLEICRALVRAANAGALKTEAQQELGRRASAFLAACANVGLIALIDEATGYQYTRPEDALQIKLRAYLEKEMRPWEKTFPDELWVEFGRLTGWEGSVQNRPKYWGHLVNELIYQYLDADVYEWLKTNQPKPRHGSNYHQWLSDQYGLPKLIEHIWMVVGMASACQNMVELKYRMAERFGRQPMQLLLFVAPPSEMPQADAN